MKNVKYYIIIIFMKDFIGKNYSVITYGCQMNVHESEKIRGILHSLGMKEIDDSTQADVVVFNTCCIREGAEDRAYNNIVTVAKTKQDKDKIVVVCGCMPQQKNGKYDFNKLKMVDIVIGTHNINNLATYLLQFNKSKSQIIDIIDKPIKDMDVENCIRDDKLNAYVNIIYGCDKFCTYCIVPHVRGREQSRNPKDIYNEVKNLVQNQGYKYITLLGQNVNSYGKDLKSGITFASLLENLCQIEGDFKIKFMTSHPMDFTDDIIKVMKKESKIAKCLHLPVQSGCSRVLTKMNRHYDIKHYNKIIRKVKRNIPNIALSTDIIVGFPTETEKEFEKTLKLIKKVKYDQIFAFMYSKRSGTPASVMDGQIPEKEKNKRLNKLLRLQKIIQKDSTKKLIGKKFNCLIKQINGVAVGITDGGKEIYIPNYKFNNQNYFADIKVDGIRNHKLSGVVYEK